MRGKWEVFVVFCQVLQTDSLCYCTLQARQFAELICYRYFFRIRCFTAGITERQSFSQESRQIQRPKELICFLINDLPVRSSYLRMMFPNHSMLMCEHYNGP